MTWRSQGGQRVSGIREVGRPEKEFNFFANFVPSFPENESESYASEPEIKFLLSRKTSATNQRVDAQHTPAEPTPDLQLEIAPFSGSNWR
jgi:hypothetical protein